MALDISHAARTITSVDIHPGAKIGPYFVIDHGTGTVIGETVEIGSNCTLLNNVILGSKMASNNHAGKRHPTLANNVCVSAFSMIFGDIYIDSNTKIRPLSTVTESILR